MEGPLSEQTNPAGRRLGKLADTAENWARNLLEVLTQRAVSGWPLWFQRVWFISLLAGGAFIWAYMLNWGNITFRYHDWAEGIGHRVAFLQDAARTGQLPLHMPDASALRNVSDRYLSIPDTIFSPQAWLLRFINLGPWVVFNTILLYAVGFFGIWQLSRKYRLSPIPVSAMFFIISFNGRISDLIVVGDIHWAGYFLLPWFVYLILQAIEGTVGWRWVMEVSGVLFLVFLQGSFHLFLISLTFMAILGLTSRRLFFPMLKGAVFALLLSMFRILPPALDSGTFDVEFLSGFDSAFQLVASTVDLKLPLRSVVFRNTPLNPLGWWEMDHYIGLIGLLFVGVLGVGLWFRRDSHSPSYRELAIPSIILAAFSIGRIFKPISALQIPMLSSQRVSTRFFLFVLLVLAILAAIHLQGLLDSKRVGRKGQFALLGGLMVLANDIWQHEKLWRVRHLPDMFDARNVDLSLAYVANHPDPPYLLAVRVGAVVSVVSFTILAYMAWHEARAANRELKVPISDTKVS